ncbi:MAG: endonuclease/exonuclease/phosphatase family protein [Pseudomonadota bacterium]|nr:endonuclease/exonuclease/phosphatase family protein [Pseudomonadota bacterium]
MSQSWRIVTYNTWKCDGLYRDRLEWMAHGLSALAPDIVCLQEAFECLDANVDTVATLAKRLGLRVHVLRSREKIRSFEGKDYRSWSNLAILLNAALNERRDVKLVAHALDPDRWALHINFEIDPGVSANVVNTHFTHIRGTSGILGRRAQARQLADRLRGETEPIILCGDLNAVWGSEDLDALVELDWAEPEEEDPGGTFIGERVGAIPDPRRIDHIQIKPGKHLKVRIKRRFPALLSPCGPHGEYPSDHAALVADISVEAA